MNDLLDLKKRGVRFVEPIWLYNVKRFLKGFWEGLKVFLLAIVMLVFFYMLAFIFLTDWEVFNKKVAEQNHQEKTSYVSKEKAKFFK